MTLTVEVDDTLPTDLRLLALRLLSGDTSAADPMLDCAMENRKGGPNITPAYVERLEDTLAAINKRWVGHYKDAEVFGLVTVAGVDLIRTRNEIWKCVTVGRELKRHW